MEDVKHECGIGAVYLKNISEAKTSVPHNLINLAFEMQSRGQRSTGISVYNPHGKSILNHHKGLGLVKEVFHFDQTEKYKKILESCSGVAGITHTRYSTSGNDIDAIDETQPFERRHAKLSKRFSIVFNGNLANYPEEKEWFLKHGYWLNTDVDTEVLMDLIAKNIKEIENESFTQEDIIKEVITRTVKNLDGAYNVILMFGDGSLVIFRDAQGFHPLVYGENEEMYAFASESSALERIGIKNFKDVEPGELIIINPKGISKSRILPMQKKHCHFEYVYFSRSKSIIDGVYIRELRAKLGKELARVETLKNEIDKQGFLVVPAPWTAVPAAHAYAEELKLDFRIAIEKKEVFRGFINNKTTRERIMNSIYDVHRYDVKERKVILIDDSLVRGETSKILVQEILSAGAKEVHLRLTEPMIKFPCFYGIDYPTLSELAVNKFNRDLQKLSAWLGVKTLSFQTIEGLAKAIGKPSEELCLACLNGNYPTPFGKKRYDEEVSKNQR